MQEPPQSPAYLTFKNFQVCMRAGQESDGLRMAGEASSGPLGTSEVQGGGRLESR